MSIRAAGPRDLDAILPMAEKLYVREALRFSRDRHRRTLEHLLTHPDDGSVWLIEADGELAGYFIITLCYSLEFGGRFALLDELFVEKDRRGRGLGSEALAFVERWCVSESIGAVRLEVGHDNPRALALYRKAGFELHERYFMTKLCNHK